MVANKAFINLFSIKSVSILIVCVRIGFSSACSAKGTIGGPTINTVVDGIFNEDTLEWIFPEEAGWSSAELQAAHQFAVQSGCQAVMALYDGKSFFPG
jgi:hypothetical protein